MEARIITCCLLLATSLVSTNTGNLFGADYTTRNFSVTAPNAQFARQVGDLAEKYRKELAIKWTGRELAPWKERCPIVVRIEQHAGGETSFVFMPDHTGRSAPSHWQMKVFGPPDRILDSVLPHEVTHTIFATHFGRPLPRWADEGACTTVEHKIEKDRSYRMLIEFLKTKRGIPFNHMFAMKQYPRDILPLYAQGHSLARYLIMLKGERHFVNYIGDGMNKERASRNIPAAWDNTTNQYYGFKDLSELQVTWLKWVSDGCPNIQSQTVSNEANSERSIAGIMPAETQQQDPIDRTPSEWRGADASQLNSRPATRVAASDSWYIDQMRNPSPDRTYREQSYQKSHSFQPGSTSRASHIEKLVANEPILFASDATSSLADPTAYVSPNISRGRELMQSPPRIPAAAYHGTLERKTIWR